MKYQEVNVLSIILDPENPRIADKLQDKEFDSIEDQNDLIQTFLRGDTGNSEAGPSSSELEKSIHSSKGIIEPIILLKNDDGKFLCIEGNTRLSIYRHFIEQYPEESIWNTIPSLVHEKLEKSDIDELRLQAHFVGKKEWTPYAKGRYITQLVDNGTSLARIKEIVGGSDAKTRANYYAFKIFNNEYVKLFNPDTDNIFPEKQKFSMFVSVPETGKNMLALEYRGYTMEDYAKWVKNKKVESPNDVVRFLEKVLVNDEAFEVFKKSNKTLRDAIPLIPSDDNINKIALKDASISQICNVLNDRLLTLSRNNSTASIRASEGESAVDNMYLLKDELASALKKLEE